jgi:hypothetical protein
MVYKIKKITKFTFRIHLFYLKYNTMSKFLKFSALTFLSFFLFLTSSVQAGCSHLSYLPTTIVHLGGTNYAYRVKINNVGPTLNGVTIDLTMNNVTSNFPVTFNNQLAGQTINPGTNQFDFAITGNILSYSSLTGVLNQVTVEVSYAGVNCPANVNNMSFNPSVDWGCTDPTAINYDVAHLLEDGSCFSSYCNVLEIHNVVEIKQGTPNPYIQLVIKNNSSANLGNVLVIPTITSSSLAVDFANTPQTLSIGPSGFDVYKLYIVGNIGNLVGSTLTLSGSLGSNVVSVGENCPLPFNNIQIDLTKVGCTSPNAVNYSSYAVIDNESCVDSIQVQKVIHQPICEGNAGSVDLTPTGGTAPHTFNYNSFDPNALLPGNYQFSVEDASPASIGGPFTKYFWVEIEEPFPFECSIIKSGAILTANSSGGSLDPTGGAFSWLKDGILYQQTNNNQLTVTENGVYRCFVKTVVAPNGEQCYAYSNEIQVTDMSINEADLYAFSVSPNPNSGNFTISMNGERENLTVQMSSLDGKIVYSKIIENTSGSIEIDANDLSSGIYLLNISGEKGRSIRKVQIN